MTLDLNVASSFTARFGRPFSHTMQNMEHENVRRVTFSPPTTIFSGKSRAISKPHGNGRNDLGAPLEDLNSGGDEQSGEGGTRSLYEFSSEDLTAYELPFDSSKSSIDISGFYRQSARSAVATAGGLMTTNSTVASVPAAHRRGSASALRHSVLSRSGRTAMGTNVSRHARNLSKHSKKRDELHADKAYPASLRGHGRQTELQSASSGTSSLAENRRASEDSSGSAMGEMHPFKGEAITSVESDRMHFANSTYDRPQESSARVSFQSKSSVGGEEHRSDGDNQAQTDSVVIADGIELRTGNDAVSFFARHGQTSRVKFVYLNHRNEDRDEFRPYDLEVVHRDRRQAEHFTMSHQGVVHVRPGRQSEFTPLGEWVRQASCFNVLSRIPFFRHFLVYKTFQLWKRNVRYQLYCQQRLKITRALFNAKDAFCPSLCKMQALCDDMRKTDLMTAPTHAIAIEDFLENHAQLCSTATKTFEELVYRLQALLDELCDTVNARARQRDDALLDVDDDDGAEVMGTRAKSKSMVAMRKEQADRARNLKRAAEEADMLGAFIRLADHLFAETLVSIVITSSEKLLSFLQAPPKTRGIFLTTIMFESNGETVFSPSQHDMHGALNQILDALVTAANAVPRILYMRQYKPYFGPQGVQGPHIGNIIRHSRRFVQTRASIHSVLESAYTKADSYAVIFAEFREIFLFTQSWDVDAYSTATRSTREARADLSRLRGWMQDIETKMKVGAPIEMLQVDAKKLKNFLLPLAQEIMLGMKRTLLNAFRAGLDAAIAQFSERTKALQERPRLLKEFAAFVQSTQQVQTEVRSLHHAATAADEMYQLLRSHDVRVPSSDQVKLDDMHEARSSFDEALAQAQLAIEQKTGPMATHLDERITALNEEVLSIMAALHSGEVVDAQADADKVLAMLETQQTTLEALTERASTYTEYQKLFQVTPDDYGNLNGTKALLKEKQALWRTRVEWHRQTGEWLDTGIHDIDAEAVTKRTEEAFRSAFALSKTERARDDPVAAALRREIEAFRRDATLISDLGNPAMRERHWEQVFALLGLPARTVHASSEGAAPLRTASEVVPDADGNNAATSAPGGGVSTSTGSYSLATLLDRGARDVRERIGEISGAASGEFALERTLAGIAEGWSEIAFVVKPYRESRDKYVLGSVEDIITQLEDNQMTLQAMQGSRYISGVRNEVMEWDQRLAQVSETLDEWLALQRNWMYLEVIFGQADIQRQLPSESAKFAQIDAMFCETMRSTFRDPNVIEAVRPTDDRVLAELRHGNAVLEEIQKSLEDYLETKRSAFPRFYFLSNDELLEILAQARDPMAVQPHLRKCFDSVAQLTFGEAPPRVLGAADAKDGDDGASVGPGTPAAVPNNVIQAMHSAEGEAVRLSSHVPTAGSVEDWLLEFESMMRITVFDACRAAHMSRASAEYNAWLFSAPAQAVLTADMIAWTGGVSTALAESAGGGGGGSLHRFRERLVAQLSTLVELVRGDLTALQRATLGALIVLDVHNRDVVNELLENNCSSPEDFDWLRQLRYYWDVAEDNCVVRQTNATCAYGYEYLGNQPRLVITPLTDKCYMTLTGALHLNLGGAPAGPAGTGKTETVKDLAKALARQCVVFNCSDGLDFRMMGRFFSGLCQAGAWACFDEFNRIDIEVLSVIAQQMLTIQSAMQAGAYRFNFEGHEIPLNTNYGVFITMNPGYAGRTELPDNLKALFRPVAMMVPDYALIAEIILYSEGFGNAKELARKMTQLYRLSSEQLSKQDHYDFGMRAVKSVLVMAGALKRSSPDVPEDVTLIRALRESNVPKFLREDVVLFEAIVSDLFPGISIPDAAREELRTAVRGAMLQQGLVASADLCNKAMQLYETMCVRHGVMLVGGAGTGKSAVRSVLGDALSTLHKQGATGPLYAPVRKHALNPKAVSMGELFGYKDAQTQEWTDGLVADTVRRAASDEGGQRHWVIFDGPVDALWIENMNTVLDDNKTLCLTNGERIKLPGTVAMIFEVADLAVASPATVSRCGMVYFEESDLAWHTLVDRWCAADTRQRYGDTLRAMIDALCPKLIAFVRDEGGELIPSSATGLVESFLAILGVLLDGSVPEKESADAPKAASPRADPPEDTAATEGRFADGNVARFVLYAATWSFGANLGTSARSTFDERVRELCAAHRGLAGAVASLPTGTSVYDVWANPQGTAWSSWDAGTRAFTFDRAAPFSALIVPTPEMTRVDRVLSLCTEARHHVLVTGSTGTGKSVMVSQFLKEQNEESCVSAAVCFSARTCARNVQDFIEGRLERKRKTLLGPPGGKRALLFVDDLNMPTREVYGAQPPLELLRQCIDQGGFYDMKKFLFTSVDSVAFLAACGSPGGGRNPVPRRLLRHFLLVNVPDLSGASIERIFYSIFSGFLLDFPPVVQALCQPVVRGTVALYERVTAELLPTPARSHYTFNLRDVGKVFQGIMQIRQDVVGTEQTLLQAWAHETARQFRDRLVSDGDRAWFDDTVQSLAASHFDVEGAQVSVCAGTELWTDLVRSNGTYAPVAEIRALAKRMEELQEEYAVATGHESPIVFFDDAVRHLARLCRILRQPRGSALLVGVGGSGRKSLTRLAAYACDCSLYEIEVTRGYGHNEFREDLKRALFAAGCDGKPSIFLLADTQIVDEAFLEDINGVLSAGEVPNLFARDEVERIVGDVRPHCRDAGVPETRDHILRLYVERVRTNLHIVLTMSPVGDDFRERCRMFPSLINCCTVDWYAPWPEQALASVAESVFAGEEVAEPEVTAGLVSLCVHIHRSVDAMAEQMYQQLRRRTYTTPTSYLDLLRLYVGLLAQQRGDVDDSVARYRSGLTKLLDTNAMVADLREDLKKMQPVLEESAQQTATLLVEVAADQRSADEVRETVAKEEKEVQEITRKAEAIRADAKADLDQALPAYNAAVKSLNSLNKADITEMKSFKNPPEIVRKVLEAVCLLKGVKTTWDEAMRQLSDMNFIDSLKEYDKDNIPDKLLKKLKKYLGDPEFQPKIVEKKSQAAKSLCMWVWAMDTYAKVARDVEPKRAKLREAEASLQHARELLEAKQANLASIETRVRELQHKYEESLAKRDTLERDITTTRLRLERAEKLTRGLGGERGRWEEQLEKLQLRRKGLVGDVLLAAACVSYAGPFTATFRKQLVQGWTARAHELGVPVGDEFSLEAILGEATEFRRWELAGLPADQTSHENALLCSRGRRWPLLIDPQEQARAWIIHTERENNIQVLSLQDTDFMRSMENCIRVGTPVLLDGVGESLDAQLEPVLLRQTVKRGGRLLIRLGDSEVDYDPNFRLYMITKLANPHFSPELCIRATVINFTVTPDGLEDQLQSEVVRHERPDLEEQRDELIVSLGRDREELFAIEDKILSMLASASGDILDDENLITTLERSKETSEAIAARVRNAEHTTLEINKARALYRPVAVRGSILYFVIADMGLVDTMYQYSLAYFVQQFRRVLSTSPACDSLDERLAVLITCTTEHMFRQVCRGLFEKDKLAFAFLIAVQIERRTGSISPSLWNLFVRGSLVVNSAARPANFAPSLFTTERAWADACALFAEHDATGVESSIQRNASVWERWAETACPAAHPLPSEEERGGEDVVPALFSRVAWTKVLCAEKVPQAARWFVRETLGDAYAEAPAFDLRAAFDDSSATTPLIFVLSAGADPVTYLQQLEKAVGQRGKLKTLSLGQGQGPHAEGLIELAVKNGEWVFLQNCHLAVSWMPRLEKLVQSFADRAVHRDFRLWLSSMPTESFPISVLQGGIKLTMEPPKGLRANMAKSYDEIDDDMFTSSKDGPWKKLLFALCFSHALLQERRKFGAIGFNVPYEFMQSDLVCSMRMLKMHVEEQELVPYETLKYVIGDVNYGGRVTDVWDQRAVRSIFAHFLVPELLDEERPFALARVEGYAVPREGDRDVYTQAVRDLPHDDDPEVFGLHRNAEISFAKRESSYFVGTVASVQPRAAPAVSSSTSAGPSPDDAIVDLAVDIGKRIPRSIDWTVASTETLSTGDPLATFLKHEVHRFNALLDVVHTSLAQLSMAVRGRVVMSAELERMRDAMLMQRVPEVWTRAAYPSVRALAGWVTDLERRVSFVNKWLVQGPPSSFWLSSFFFPQGFLTAVLQRHARAHNVAIDALKLRTHISQFSDPSRIATLPSVGVYAHGLYLEGAAWDSSARVLAEARPGELHDALPVLWLEPVDSASPVPEDTYEAPMYKTLVRAGELSTTGHSTNFVTTVHVPTTESPDHWVRRGTALFLALDD